MKQKLFILVWIAFLGLIHQPAGAQGFLKKLKDKVEKKAEEIVDKKLADKTGVGSSNTSNNNVNGNGLPGQKGMDKPANKNGEGLKNTTPPDVVQQLTDADQAYQRSQYGDARFSIQQALLGVELQLGKNLLQSLPQEINGLPLDSADDRVMSTRYGWANLTIQRNYQKEDKQLSILIGNNSVYAGMLDLYFGFAATQSNGETQDVKQIRVKGHKGIIKFDQHDGYTVLVQLGQSGMITWQGINFSTEQEMMDAVNKFDIENIRKTIGE